MACGSPSIVTARPIAPDTTPMIVAARSQVRVDLRRVTPTPLSRYEASRDDWANSQHKPPWRISGANAFRSRDSTIAWLPPGVQTPTRRSGVGA